MSRPRTLVLAAGVARTDVETARGTFAALSCLPLDSSLPRGQVLLIPGFTGSKEDFAALLPLLAQAGWSAATYDQRGQYESPAEPGDDFSLAGLAADARAVSASVFGTAERVHLVGHSFGGLVAASAALAWPTCWASLTLLCSGPGGLNGGLRDEVLAAAAAVERRGVEWLYQEIGRRDRKRGWRPESPEIEEFLHRRFVANSAESLAAIARHLGQAPDQTAELAALGLPVNVLRGEHDTWPHDVQDRLAAALGTQVVVIADAAHSPAWEQPEETRDALVRLWMS